LRDLRRLAMGRGCADWEGRLHGRLTALPDEATPLQRAELMVALSAGHEILCLQRFSRHLGLGAKLDAALGGLAEGHSARTIAQLSELDDALAADVSGTTTVLRARASILALTAALKRHSAYFDAEARL
jgi:hypothetical protein